jgi:isoamylase
MTDLRPVRPLPQGSAWDGDGVNFSLFSENAERVELCLLADDGSERRIDIRDRTAHLWHVYVPGTGPGQRYGYRVHGPHAPEQGMRFNPAKLLIDPYAKAIDGAVDWKAANTLPYPPGADEDADLSIDGTDDAAAIPGSVVVDPDFDWEGDRGCLRSCRRRGARGSRSSCSPNSWRGPCRRGSSRRRCDGQGGARRP